MASNHSYHRSGLGRALLAALAFVVGGASAFASGTQYYVNDHLATTVGIADAAGEIAALEADAFGSPIAAGANSGRYTGKPYDEDMGAYVFPFRNYRADEGRWMTADPSGFPDGHNNYRYAPDVNNGFDAWGLASANLEVGWTHGTHAGNYKVSFTYSWDAKNEVLTYGGAHAENPGWTGNGASYTFPNPVDPTTNITYTYTVGVVNLTTSETKTELIGGKSVTFYRDVLNVQLWLKETRPSGSNTITDEVDRDTVKQEGNWHE